jgi:hypothetical protein
MGGLIAPLFFCNFILMISAKLYSPVLYDESENPENFLRGTSAYHRFWEEQYQRCMNGFTPTGGSHIPGNYYFYLNFCKINAFDKKINRKRPLPPLYRDLDHEYFNEINKCKDEGAGIIVLKARRKGFSFMNANVLLHEWTFHWGSENGMGAQIESYVSDFYKKLLLTYNNIYPQFRNQWLLQNSALFKGGYKEKEDGVWIEKGSNSQIYFRLIDKPDKFRGTTLTWWVVDEAGEVKDLKKVYFANEECFREGAVQFGVPIIGGTSNKMSHDSEDFSDMWYNHEQYNLRQFFVPASKCYYPFFNEETGESDMEAAKKDILKRLKEKKGDRDQYYAFKQEMPLTPEDAFVVHGSTPFDLDKINNRVAELSVNKKEKITQRGRLEWAREGDDGPRQFGKAVEFVRDKLGPFVMAERPLPGVKNADVAAVDPYHISDDLEEDGPKSKKDSKGCMYVYRRFVGIDVPCEMPVMEYYDRPYSKEDFYENCLKVCIFYNCQVLCEYNDDGFFKYFEKHKMTKYLKMRPRSADSVYNTATNKYGLHMKEAQKRILTDLVDEYIKRHVDDIYFLGLLKEMAVYGKKNTDRVMAFGMCLIFDMDNTIRIVKDDENKNIGNDLPFFEERKRYFSSS